MRLVDQSEILEYLRRVSYRYFTELEERANTSMAQIMDEFIKMGWDQYTLGFWIWDIQKNIEHYSPGYRRTLGFSDCIDFPNSPQSWQNQILPKDLKRALVHYEEHFQSGGVKPYRIQVTYKKKDSEETIDVICLGKIVKWNKEKQPLYMMGFHLNPPYYITPKIDL